jgi:hypothetical protein
MVIPECFHTFRPLCWPTVVSSSISCCCGKNEATKAKSKITPNKSIDIPYLSKAALFLVDLSGFGPCISSTVTGDDNIIVVPKSRHSSGTTSARRQTAPIFHQHHKHLFKPEHKGQNNVSLSSSFRFALENLNGRRVRQTPFIFLYSSGWCCTKCHDPNPAETRNRNS